MATIFFWLGRNKFVHIPAGGLRFVRETFSGEGLRALAKLLLIYLFVAMFFALYNQTGSVWVLEAEKMDRLWLGITWLPSQVQATNPILILVFIPLFSYGIYPAIGRFFPLTPLRKISIGFFLTSLSFVVPAWIEMKLAAGETPSIGWQVLAYAILTAAEVMVSITCLEFSYTQAPREMKSIIMAIFLFSDSVGNLFTAAVTYFIEKPNGQMRLTGADYYLFYAGLMAATAVIFIFVARCYREKTYIQPEAADPPA